MAGIRNCKALGVRLMGYTLKNVHVIRGREGYGYQAELWKSKKMIGYLEDWGDGGGVNPKYSHTMPQEEIPVYSTMLINDMKQLLTALGVTKNALANDWLNNAYSAMEGFAELLLELDSLRYLVKQKMKKDGTKETNKNHYAMVRIGTGWFSDSTKYIPTKEISVKLGESVSTRVAELNSLATMFSKIEQYRNVPFDCVILCNTKTKWEFDLDSYVQMYKDAAKVAERVKVNNEAMKK